MTTTRQASELMDLAFSNKAVADGAVSYFIDHLVSSRVARYTYGTECSVPYSPFDAEHRARQKQVFRSASGILALPRAFSSILAKVPFHCIRRFIAYAQQGTRVSEQQEFNEAFAVRRYNQAACNNVEVGIMSYRGSLTNPNWVDTERGKTHICPSH